ncbi:hypothetical protein HPB48_011392 [Haemaphysalis longicornis]|uniref:Uncharacterized protein n=1 Tax=Haemaphysalis longicornis TaxID=44386 RepID=A0A9J6GH14_HAELO|nr:hypothetical protein HPB48_011392 [Haemaphysalis longicornis]
MMPHIEENADIFIKSMEKYADSNEEVHMLRKFEELAMDYVARGAFGIDERFQGKPDHPAIAVAKATLRGAMVGPFHMIALYLGNNQKTNMEHASQIGGSSL